jgi:hypothetical protein
MKKAFKSLLSRFNFSRFWSAFLLLFVYANLSCRAQTQSVNLWSSDFSYPLAGRFENAVVSPGGSNLFLSVTTTTAFDSFTLLAVLDNSGQIRSLRKSDRFASSSVGWITAYTFSTSFPDNEFKVGIYSGNWVPKLQVAIFDPTLKTLRDGYAFATEKHGYVCFRGADNQVRVAALDLSGKLKWAYRFTGFQLALSFVDVRESVDEDAFITFAQLDNGSYRNITCKINQSGQILWSLESPFAHFFASLSDGSFLGCHIEGEDSFYYKLDPNGQLLWSYKLASWQLNGIIGEGTDGRVFLLLKKAGQLMIVKLSETGEIEHALGIKAAQPAQSFPWLWKQTVNGELVLFFDNTINSIAYPHIGLFKERDLSPEWYYWPQFRNPKNSAFHISTNGPPLILGAVINGTNKARIFTTDLQTGAGCYPWSRAEVETFSPDTGFSPANVQFTNRPLSTASFTNVAPTTAFTGSGALSATPLCATTFEPVRLEVTTTETNITVSSGALSPATIVLEKSHDLDFWEAIQTNKAGVSPLKGTLPKSDFHFFRALSTRP